MPDGDEVVTRLLARLMSEPGKNLPTGLFGRARRTASAALRTGTSAFFGGGKLDARTAERLALSLGELKGIAMKVGQILSYVDIPLPEETRRVLAVLRVKSRSRKRPLRSRGGSERRSPLTTRSSTRR